MLQGLVISLLLGAPAAVEPQGTPPAPAPLIAPKDPRAAPDLKTFKKAPWILENKITPTMAALEFFSELKDQLEAEAAGRQGAPLKLRVVLKDLHESPRKLEDDFTDRGSAGWMDLELGLFAPDGRQVFGWSTRLSVKRSDARGHGGFQTAMTRKLVVDMKRFTQ
ncbi:MAG: hypothetical protein HY915_06255 [Desulfovibrio sp.]|nr:hypothetical protein [Desulfovibrio sp.]